MKFQSNQWGRGQEKPKTGGVETPSCGLDSKGYVLTLDAIIAVMAFLIILIGFMLIQYQKPYESGGRFERLYSITEDAIDILNKNGILEQVVFYWSENNLSLANETSRLYLDQILASNIGYRFEIGNLTISDNSRIMENEAGIKTNAERWISGYSINKSVNEFISMTWLLYNNTSINKTYTISNVSYGNSFRTAIGSNWTIEHNTTSGETANESILVPKTYSGNKKLNYTKSSYSYPNTDDSIDDAVYRLLLKLDSDNDGAVNLIDGREFNPANMTIIPSVVPAKSMHETVKVRLVVWMK